MGSKVYTTSVATDNRLAVTDQGFGLSSSGTGNNTALKGHILNISGGGGQGYKGVGGASGGVNVNLLDGEAIQNSFAFAQNSLSMMLDSIISGQKTTQAAAQYTADAIGNAVAQSAQTTATAQVEQAGQTKKYIVLAVAAAAGFWLWKGRK